MPQAPSQLELVTPENVAIPFVVATVSSRIQAFLLDLVVIAVGLGVIVVVTMTAIPGAEGASGYVEAVFLLAAFALRNFYFVFAELKWHGRTVGKRRLGLRVIARDGGPLTADMIFARNLTRDLEVFIPLTLLLAPGLVGGGVGAAWRWLSLLWLGVIVLLPFLNRFGLRLGDVVAGTVVVQEPRGRLLQDLVVERETQQALEIEAVSQRFVFTNEQLDVYGIHELQVLEDVLRREPVQRDADLLDTIAEKIKRKIQWSKKRWKVPSEPFLRAFYAAQRARLEQKMLLGKRQERKVR